jgi:hypothetical protein
VIGNARRWNTGKSTCTFNISASKPGEAVRRGDQLLAERGQVVEPLVQAEIFEPIDADLHAKERVAVGAIMHRTVPTKHLDISVTTS